MTSSRHPLPDANATAPSEAPASPAASPPATPFRYALILILFPLLAIPSLIQLGRSNFFLHHGASVWVRANDSIFDMHDRDCDVLVFGDSTAMTGIDPEVVENHTGFRTCNISVTNAVLAVTNNLVLDHYLARNTRPRVLLVQLSPDDFQPEGHAWHQTIYAEGLLELLRHGTSRQVRNVLLQHPQESISFAGYAAGFSAWYALKEVWFHTTHIRSEEDSVEVHNGFFTPPMPARTTCVPATSVVSPGPSQASFSRSLVADYKHTYAAHAGVVLVNVAPIPACDQNLNAYSAELDGVTSNSLLPLPIGFFNDGRHYTARGSEVVSTLIAKELNAVATSNPSIDDRIRPGHTIATFRRTHTTATAHTIATLRPTHAVAIATFRPAHLRIHHWLHTTAFPHRHPSYDVLIFPPYVSPFEAIPTDPQAEDILPTIPDPV